ncbi:hypothetical protein B0H13DRAFT_2320188 [Mycena leptocephala]|nr:hypothetical protein B0H13DRAFT_2320188 [Mycena leptocephala]
MSDISSSSVRCPHTGKGPGAEYKPGSCGVTVQPDLFRHAPGHLSRSSTAKVYPHQHFTSSMEYAEHLTSDASANTANTAALRAPAPAQKHRRHRTLFERFGLNGPNCELKAEVCTERASSAPSERAPSAN